MRKVFAAGLVAFLATLGLAFTGAPASAAEGLHPVESKCLTGWYTNPDEGGRLPEQVEAGLKFEESALIHHATDLKLAKLKPGSYHLAQGSETPDQPSFFSVEIRDPNEAYGTLRWDGTAWTLTTNVDVFTETDPAAFIGKATKWGVITKDTRVVSFGVGYTQNPPGTKTVTVKSVTFAGKTYGLGCKPVRATPVTEKDYVTPANCESAAKLKDLPEVEHVTYATRIGTKGQTVVTAKADEGYYIEGNSRWNLTLPDRLTGDACLTVINPDEVKPVFTWTCDGTGYTEPDSRIKYTFVKYDEGKAIFKGEIKDPAKFTFTDNKTSTEWKLAYQVPTGCEGTPSPTPSPTTGNPGTGGGGSTPSNVADAGDLPVTGPGGGPAKLLAMAGTGTLMFAVGGLLLVWARRRRDADTVEFE